MDGKTNGSDPSRQSRKAEPLEFDFAADDPRPISPEGPGPSAAEEEKAAYGINQNETASSKPFAADGEIPNRSKPMSNIKPPTISDFRKNAERQTREQKTVSGVIAVIAYGLLAGLIFVACLAGFGGYVLWKQIKEQSVTVAQLDDKYKAEVVSIREDLKSAHDENDQLTARVAAQQQKINQITASLEETSAIMKTERAQRARDMAALQNRVRTLESRRY